MLRDVGKMTDEQRDRAINFALDLIDLVENKQVVGDWECRICMGASNILLELVNEEK